jgi:hypothetical protein
MEGVLLARSDRKKIHAFRADLDKLIEQSSE